MVMDRTCRFGLAASAVLLLGTACPAADITLLHSFGRPVDPPNALALFGATLVGTTAATGSGSVFQLGTDGSAYATLHTFNSGKDEDSDGTEPSGAPVVLDGTVFGATARGGGSADEGTVYSLRLRDATFHVLHRFDGGDDGACPTGGLARVGPSLYGMTEVGGGKGGREDHGAGTIFRLNPDGSGYARLYAFDGGDDGQCKNPTGALTAAASHLYGFTRGRLTGIASIASERHESGVGVIFCVGVDGSGFRVLHSFAAAPPRRRRSDPGGGDGLLPVGTPAVVGSMLFGTTEIGGVDGGGTLFKCDLSGNTFTPVPTVPLPDPNRARSRGFGELTVAGNWLYGTASCGGPVNAGSLFRLRIDGTGLQVLHWFVGGPKDGAVPHGNLTVTDSAVYGITVGGGASDNGCVFRLPLPDPR